MISSLTGKFEVNNPFYIGSALSPGQGAQPTHFLVVKDNTAEPVIAAD
jgi:hypothetical protein